MKKKAIILLFIFSLEINSFSEEKSDELIDIISFLTTNHYNINHWDVTMKEKVSHNRAKSLVEELKKDHVIEMIEDEKKKKFFYQIVDDQHNIIESYIIIAPKSEQYSPEIIITIEGVEWDKQVFALYEQKLDKMTKTYFTKYARRYTCVKSISNGIIKDMNFVNLLEEKLNFRQISIQKDKINQNIPKKIVYGFNPIWNQEIKLFKDYMNVHVVLQQTDDEKLKVIIGTPILINEY